MTERRTLTNSEYTDEMLHNASFHQGLHCLLNLKRLSDIKDTFLKKYNLTPLKICTMDYHKFIVSNKKEESINIKRVKSWDQYHFLMVSLLLFFFALFLFSYPF